MSDASRILDDPGTLGRLDPHGAHEALVRFPEQCRAALGLGLVPAVRVPTPSLVVIAGMGGSAAGGDLLAACLAGRLPIPILTHRGYGLPATVGPSALVIASSYSGQTAETLSALDRALAAGAPTCVVTSGGPLGARAAARGLPAVTLPGGLMPRFALGYLFFALLPALDAAGLARPPAEDVSEAIAVVGTMSRELSPASPLTGNAAKRLAAEVGDRLPVVYGGQLTAAAAYRWKTDFEENAKCLAVAGFLPEMNHNEVEAWRAPAAARFHAILLRDDAEPPEVGRRFAVLEAMIGPVAGGVSSVAAHGQGRLARLLSLVYLGQWASYYLALLRGVDPWTVPRLEELKRRLGS